MKIIELLIGPSYPIEASVESAIENRMNEIKNLNSNISIFIFSFLLNNFHILQYLNQNYPL